MKEVLTRRFVHGMEERAELDRKEIDKEFADIIENEEKTLIGLTGIQYESALKIIEENEA